MKVVFHVVELEKWGVTLNNVRDLLSADPNADVKIIAMNKAANLFSSYSGVDFNGILDNPHVEIIISKRAMEEYKLHSDLLPMGIKVEELVIPKIVGLQNEGYAYIRL